MPTAYAAREVAATPVSALPCANDGLDTLFRDVPFQCSTRVWLPAAPASPTARASRSETAATPSSPELAPRALPGDGTVFHAVPFQWRLKVLVYPLSGSPASPTAQALRADVASRRGYADH